VRSGLWACLPIALSAGCSSLLTSDVPPDTVYWLEAFEVPRSAPIDGAPSITVRFTAAPGLDGDRVLVRGPGATLKSYAGARWADRVPEVLNALVRTVLEDSGRFSRVSSSTSGVRADWVLDLELRAFYAVLTTEGSSPTIEVEIRGYLECPSRDLPIRIASQVSVSANTLTSIAEGFQNAVDMSAMQLMDQLAGRC
jgi:cholesterol transport system auxiliary component